MLQTSLLGRGISASLGTQRAVTGRSFRARSGLGFLVISAVLVACSAQQDGTGERRSSSLPAGGDPALVATGKTATTGGGAQSSGVPSTAGGTGSSNGGPSVMAPIVKEESSPVVGPVTPSPPATGGGEVISGVVCSSKDIAFTKEIPTVLILVDRSTSMFASNLPNGGSGPFGTSPDRWEAMRAAVKELRPFATDVIFALTTYTSFNMTGKTCPDMPQLGTVAMGKLGVDAFDALLKAIPASKDALPASKSETPTGAAIKAGAEALLKFNVAGPKYLLVITDGDPDTCKNFDPQCGQDLAIGAAQAAFTSGVKTFVVGLSEDVDDTFLNDLAHAGQGQEVVPVASNDLFCIQGEPKEGTTVGNDFFNNWRANANGTYGADGMKYKEELFFKPKDVGTFSTQVKQVVNGVRSCEFKMDTAVKRDAAGKGGVRLETKAGAMDLKFGDPNGWALSTENDFTVVFNGTACEALKNDAEPHVKIEFPCEIRVPIVF